MTGKEFSSEFRSRPSNNSEKSNTGEVMIPPEAQGSLINVLYHHLWNETRNELFGGDEQEKIKENDILRGLFIELVEKSGEELDPIFWLHTGILEKIPSEKREEYKGKLLEPEAEYMNFLERKERKN